MTLETLGHDLVYSKTKYISDLFNEETLMVDVANDDYISIYHHTYQNVSLSTCNKVANHIRKKLDYKNTIFVGGYNFTPKKNIR